MTDQLEQLVEARNFHALKSILTEMLPPDIAIILDEIKDTALAIKLFRSLPKDMAAEVFSYFESDVQEHLVNLLTDKELANIMEELGTDDAVDFVEEMPADIVERALKISTSETRQAINKFLRFEENTAGAIMTSEFLDLQADLTVGDAIKKIRKTAKDLETVNVLYVTDKSKVIKGSIDIRELIMAEPSAKLEDIMEDAIVYAYTYTDQEEVAQIFKKYDILVLPITDTQHHLVGIVTVDDVIEVIEQEAEEDFEKMAALTPSDKPYLKTSVLRICFNRLPWLLLLMISATFTGIIINTYEATLSSISTYLFACVPMLMDTGGNAGGQASVTVIRGIALNEIKFKDSLFVVWKEIRVSLILGACLAVVCFAKLQLVDSMLFGYGYTPLISFVVCLALFVTVVLAKTIGCLFPLLAKKCKLDPAVVASPFITTIVDALSLILYCNIALSLLN